MSEHATRDAHAKDTGSSSQGASEALSGELNPATKQSEELTDAATTSGAGANPGSYSRAREAHREDLKKLDDTIAVGLNEHSTKYGEAWPNAAAWLRAGKTKLVALTQTHDGAARAKALGKPDKVAMFGIDAVTPTDSGYAQDNLKDKSNIYCAKPTWGGFRSGGGTSTIAIIQPRTRDASRLRAIIVHEVQHDADHHGASKMERFITEFRAYWVDQSNARHKATSGSADPRLKTKDGVTLSGFDNRRQQAIFKHLWDSGSYDYVKELWKSAADRQRVLAFKSPTGTNLVNSPRIDDVYLALSKRRGVEAVMAAASKLTPSDLKAIAAGEMRAEWEALINKSFQGATRTRVLGAVGLKPRAPGVQWAVVDQIYEMLQGSKPDANKLMSLASQLKAADRAALQAPEMKSEWTGLVEKRLKGAARAQLLKALGLDK
ncbi:hypothetical protein KKF91_05840 [Myxococcota bacterium]|nr:hypothetical protein [Myxococcota bacterium]MBU1430072.1 hypothetical protein [Myxococcota bacterium]MBU1900101.1 hypothetical protein [Myxococcota bacterium]